MVLDGCPLQGKVAVIAHRREARETSHTIGAIAAAKIGNMLEVNRQFQKVITITPVMTDARLICWLRKATIECIITPYDQADAKLAYLSQQGRVGQS